MLPSHNDRVKQYAKLKSKMVRKHAEECSEASETATKFWKDDGLAAEE